METKEFSSLSAEFVNDAFPGFVCTVFEASAQLLMEDGVPSQAFLEREEEFNIITVHEVGGADTDCIILLGLGSIGVLTVTLGLIKGLHL